MWKKVGGGLAAVIIIAGVFFFFGNREVRTEVRFPAQFTPPSQYCAKRKTTKLVFSPGREEALLDALNDLKECTLVELTAGTFRLSGALTIARVNGIHLRGAGKDKTVLKFVDAGNVNGVDVEAANSFAIEDLTILDSPKNGLEIRLSKNITIRNLKVTWSVRSGPAKTKNGAYGVYPVNVVNVLLEKTDTYYASDAGLYVGQCVNAVVRGNRAEENVMGLEIENTVNADVYDNVVQKNTGGLLVYDLNKNTIVTRNVRVFNNIITDNNTDNFGHAGLVKSVPAGVGMIITAAREIEIYGNRFANNNSADIVLLSGLISETPDTSKWPQKNFRVHGINIRDNAFMGGSGGSVDNGRFDTKERPMGKLVALLKEKFNEARKSANKAPLPMANIIYDGVDDGRTFLALTNTWFGNKAGNHNGICIRGNSRGKIRPALMDMNMPALLNNSSKPGEASIRAAVRKGAVVHYPGDNNYGGESEFGCAGFRGTGVPVKGLGT